MMMAATLSTAGRAAPRFPAARPATLRDAQRNPIDIFIENLSADGFGMSTTTGLAPGARVSLRLAGIEPREARVVRRLGLSYGCEFLVPLDARDLTKALDAGAVVSGAFPSGADKTKTRGGTKRVSRLGRVAILAWVNIVLWVAIVAGLHAMLQ